MRRRPPFFPALVAVAIAAVLGGAAAVVVRRADDGRPRRAALASPSPTERRGGTLRVVADEDLDSLDPQRAGTPRSWFVVRALHRGLMAFPNARFPEGARPVPDLAERMEVSADGLRYTFPLRGDARFGSPASRPVRGPDVRAGIERLIRSGSGVARWFGVIRRIRAAPLTVVVELARPANDLPWLVALPQASAFPRELAGRLGVTPAAIAPSGPYRIAEYAPERRLRLVRNPAWSASSDPVRAAWVDEVDVEIGVPPDRQIDLVADGRADVSLDGPAVRTLPPLGGAQIAAAPNGCLRYLWMNTTVAPFTDAGARRAVAAAVDRAAIAATYGTVSPSRRVMPARGVLPPTVFGSLGPGAAPPRTVPAVRSISSTLVVGDTALDARQATLVVRAAARAGVRLASRRVPVSTLYSDLYEVPASRVPMGLATWCADWPGLGGRGMLAALLDGRLIRPNGNSVYSQLRSPALARLIDAAARLRDEQEAAAAWAAVDRYAARFAAVVPLAWLEEISVVGARVGGFVPHALFARGDPTALWVAAGL